MKKAQIFFNACNIFLTVVVIAVLSIYGYKKLHKLQRAVPFVEKHSHTSATTQDPSLKRRLIAAKYPVKEQKPIAVIITSYNNEKVCEKNLESIFSQTYKNYRIIYVDDCSTDQTYQKVADYIAARGQVDRVELIRNPKKSIKMANLYKACLSCKDDEIIITCDGDDWLIHEGVLAIINQYYQNPDVWMTHGSAIIHPGYREITGRAYDEHTVVHNEIRDAPFRMSMLRTFYAGLFKQLKLKDLLFNGDFIPTADDVAFMVPLAEMAGQHCIFVPEVLYVINDCNPIREMRIAASLQELLPMRLREKEKYLPLEEHFNPRRVTSCIKAPPSVYVFASGEPDLLRQSLSAMIDHLFFYSDITVLCKSHTEEYRDVAKTYPQVKFIFTHHAEALEEAMKREGDYVVLASDRTFLQEPLNLSDYLKDMERTKASAFLIGHPEAPLPTISLDKGFAAMTIYSLTQYPEVFEDAFFMAIPKTQLCKLISVKNFSAHVMETYLTSVLHEEDVSLLPLERKCIVAQNL